MSSTMNTTILQSYNLTTDATTDATTGPAGEVALEGGFGPGAIIPAGHEKAVSPFRTNGLSLMIEKPKPRSPTG